MKENKKGFVYILTNPSFKEDWVKIGKCSRPVDIRTKELDNTAVPLPFDIYATLETCKYEKVERLVHKTIDRLTDLRIRQNREFFNITPSEALAIFRDIAETLDDAVINEYNTESENTTNTKCDKEQPPRFEKRKQFWSQFIQYCNDNNGLFANNSPSKDNWIGKSIKVPYGIVLNAVIGLDFARMEIYFNSGSKETNEKVFDYLHENKDIIEKEYGSTLGWERLSDKVTCRIKDVREYNCFDTEDKTEIFRFLKESSDKMATIFHKHIIEYKNQQNNK